MRPPHRLPTDTQMNCPVCDELIPAEAITCRHCGAELVDDLADPHTGAKVAGKDAVPELDGAETGAGPFSGHFGPEVPRLVDEPEEELTDREPADRPGLGATVAPRLDGDQPDDDRSDLPADADQPREDLLAAEASVSEDSITADGDADRGPTIREVPAWNEAEFERIAQTGAPNHDVGSPLKTSFDPWPEGLVATDKPRPLAPERVRAAAIVFGLVALVIIGVLLYLGPFELHGNDAPVQASALAPAIGSQPVETPGLPVGATLPAIGPANGAAAAIGSPGAALPRRRSDTQASGEASAGQPGTDRALSSAPAPANFGATRPDPGSEPASARPNAVDGRNVARAQTMLARWGYYHHRVDGQEGPMTRRALLAFQSDVGLPRTGRVDPATIRALERRPVQRFIGHPSANFSWESLSRDR